MPAEVTLLPSGHRFSVQEHDTLLEAALRAGLAPDYGCSSGNCGLCKARVISGIAERVRPHDYVMSESEKSAGYILMCACAARTDLVLEAGEARDPRDIPLQHIAARVRRVEPLSERVSLLHVQTPRTHRLRFLAGQSVRVTLGAAPPRELPIASCPCDDRNLQFHVARDDSDPFARHVHGELRSGELVAIEGPRGDFTLSDDLPSEIVFLAWGTGFAPVKSLVEHVMALDEGHTMRLYWIAQEGGHYLDNLCRSWADALERFRYVPISGPEAHALDGVLAAEGSLADKAVYAAGPATAIASARERLARAGLPSAHWRAAVT
ncbi:ferredoxin [Sulfurifustis variabilis]|uniref:Ferredoxin n=1 Tax=Sulfurifustis variabilis TaxID=1675686 RepID=A0A1B4V0V2_9GAMM|nr:2Fe-2S iron-sulfur cluster-binding protein [Sulfurifustis variabilis]BAU46845.1 ferredoxin [Sulfurifustis variabilis]